ncbi:transcriptional regulator family: Fungal Specific TF [Penicillium angulare]|uniref:transcriptional regulator family: Fungal Specific TF n=1 Tax=Penicillium angulare TaxID=116970 RepID=UPI002540063C|nr:transcriptional regulator family: Fungal Specific TF [Penicillium angulare]KAJ5273650.1 transcriptional regulator family: Fungal Specific TF [Penicillium angulare]
MDPSQSNSGQPPQEDTAARRKRAGRKYTSRACEECRRRRAKYMYKFVSNLKFTINAFFISVMARARLAHDVLIEVFDANIQPPKMEDSPHQRHM